MSALSSAPRQRRGRNGAIDHFAERKARLDARHARQPGEFGAVDALEILDTAGIHRDNVVVGARHQEAADHGRALHDGFLESVQSLFALAVEADAHDDRGAESEPVETEHGLVTGDQPRLFQRLLPTRACGRRQADPRRQLGVAEPAMRAELGQDGSVYPVQIQAKVPIVVSVLCAGIVR